jgi:hypothetical protein
MKKYIAVLEVVALALIVASCGGASAEPTATQSPPMAGALPTAAIRLPPETPVATAVVPTQAAVSSASVSADPTTSAVLSAPEEKVPGYSISGVPAKVDPTNLLRAQGKDAYGNTFTNTLGLGTEMLLAETGTALVGPDIDPNIVKGADGRLVYISPNNQYTLNNPGETDSNAAEGAFLWFTGATVNAEVRGITIKLDGMEGHNWFLIIRGLFADNTQDKDRNSTVHFTDYVAGHAQVMLYPAGAYISEGNFTQVAELSHTGGTNCGHEGCSGLTVMMLDLNTGAWTVVHQPQLDAPWEFVASNWR